MRLVGYLRVSTAEQVDDGEGLETQEQVIGAWAAAEGHTIVGWYRDEALSGKDDLERRVGLAGAIAAIESGRAKGMVVRSLDRFSRRLILQEQLLDEVARAGGRVFSTSAAESEVLVDDPDDPARTLIRQVLGSIAEYDRKMIRLRMVAGAKRKTAAGGYAWGRPGYGWRAEDKELVPVAEEQAIIARIRELRSGPKPMSFARVAATLNGEGRLRRGKGWVPETVRRAAMDRPRTQTQGSAKAKATPVRTQPEHPGLCPSCVAAVTADGDLCGSCRRQKAS